MTAIRKYTLLPLCLLLIGLLSVRFVKSSPTENSDFQLATVSPGNFDVMVNTVGTLDAARSYMVSSTIKGDKGKIIYLIGDGSRVREGDVLVKLDSAPFEAEAERLKGEVSSLEAAVEASHQLLEWEKNQVEREIRTAEFNLKIARLELKKLVEGDGPLQLAQFKEETEKAREEYHRYLSYISDLKALSLEGYGNPTEIALAGRKASGLKEKYESANKKYVSYQQHVLPSFRETAVARVEKAEMELEQTEKGSVYKIAKALSSQKEIKGKLQTAKNSLRHAHDELDKTTIRASFPGIAILYEAFRDGQKRKPREGDRVLRNQPLLYLPDISSMIIKTQVREVDLHKIALGQKCMIRADAYPDTLFEGEVIFVGVLATGRFGRTAVEKYFQLTVSLKNEDPRVRPGMTARVSILTEQVRNALSVPVQAVFDEGGVKYCHRFLGKKFEKVRVSLGRRNEDMSEIISGLQEGDRISLIRPSLEDH